MTLPINDIKIHSFRHFEYLISLLVCHIGYIYLKTLNIIEAFVLLLWYILVCIVSQNGASSMYISIQFLSLCVIHSFDMELMCEIFCWCTCWLEYFCWPLDNCLSSGLSLFSYACWSLTKYFILSLQFISHFKAIFPRCATNPI